MKMANAVPCDQCGVTIDAKAPGNAEQVTGFRINRTQGGANMVAFAEPTGRYICRACVTLRRSGLSWTQPSLFD